MRGLRQLSNQFVRLHILADNKHVECKDDMQEDAKRTNPGVLLFLKRVSYRRNNSLNATPNCLEQDWSMIFKHS